MYKLADEIKKKLWLVGFASIFFKLLIFQKYTRRVKNHVLFSCVPYFSCIHSIGPRWTPLSVELNASTFIITNRNFWFGSYWEIGNNIFHHGHFVFFFVVYFEQCCTYLDLSIFSIARLNHCYKPRGYGSKAFEPCCIFNCKVEPLYVILNRASQLFSMDF